MFIACSFVSSLILITKNDRIIVTINFKGGVLWEYTKNGHFIESFR